MSRPYLLEQVDDAAIVQYYADGFDHLPVEQKILVWHLYQAALAGRDIYYDQRYRHGLEMRAVIEQILLRCPPDAEGLAEVLAEIRRYAKLFWINSGPYNNTTARKFVLRCAPAEFRRAAHVAAANGATFPLNDGEGLDGLLQRLERPFFDASAEPMVTSKCPGPGEDVLTASANNLYQGGSMADLEGFEERYGLNSRLVRREGQLREQVYRVGGLYGDHIARIVGHLRSALAYATPSMRKALEALIRFYESGEEVDRIAYDIAWVQDTDSPIDTVNGFVEFYLDPRSVKGAWEGIVCYVNQEKTTALARLADAAAWFESRLPCSPEWRRSEVTGVTARAVDVVVEMGDAGPLSAIGINLPNDQRIRERHGSKSVSLVNITEACYRSEPPALLREFCWSNDEVSRAEQWGALANEVATALHEVLGHGSGRVADRLEGRPHLALRETYSSIEEARADLVALYFVREPRVADLGLLPAAHQTEIVLTAYEDYARRALLQLRKVREGVTLEEDHMRNRQLIVNWLLAHTRAIDVRVREGRTYHVVVDVDAFHDGVSRLFAEVQDIKSEGDYERAHRLVDTYGTRVDPALRDEVVTRVDRLGLPAYTAFVQPRLEPVVDAAGHVVDVHVSYPLDLERQMLEYSGLL
jgi:dipeptidyl-peptidase-3